jgi:hypothetical protein
MKTKFKAMKCCLNDENTDQNCFNKDLIGLKDLYEKETISDDDEFEQSESSNSDSDSSF